MQDSHRERIMSVVNTEQEQIRELQAEVRRLTLENLRLTKTINQIYASAVHQETGFNTNLQQSENFAKTNFGLFPPAGENKKDDSKPAVVLQRVTSSGRSNKS